MFVSTVPTSGHKPLAPPSRGVLTRPTLPVTRPISSITPVRPNKPHPASPTTAVKSHARTKPSSANTSAITGVPIAVSPVVNIRPPAVMAQIAANKPLSVALGNPAVSVYVSHPASVAISNPSSLNNPVPVMTSAVSCGHGKININAPPAGVTPIAKIRPPFQVSCCYCIMSL